MTKYYIRHTDITKNPVEIEEGSINEADFDIALFGRIRLEYGERLNQNLLNLTENFAVGMDPNLIPPTPTPMPSFSPSAGPVPSVTPSIGSSPTPTPNLTPTPTPSLSVDVLTLSSVPPAIAINDADDGNPTAWYSLTFNSNGTFDYSTSEGGGAISTYTWLTSGDGSSYELSYADTFATLDPGPGPNIWHDLSTPVTFYTSTVPLEQYELVITIRNKVNTAYSKTKTIYVTIFKSGI